MFDLEAKLTQWKSNLLLSESLTPEDAQELEQHLRDTFSDLTARGVSSEDALGFAFYKLGEVGEISTEFSKVNQGLFYCHRAMWVLTGILFVHLMHSITASVMSVMSYLSVHPMYYGFAGPASWGVFLGLLAVFLFASRKRFDRILATLNRCSGKAILLATMLFILACNLIRLGVLAGPNVIIQHGVGALVEREYKVIFGTTAMIVELLVVPLLCVLVILRLRRAVNRSCPTGLRTSVSS